MLASICLFRNSSKPPSSNTADVPDELFLAAQRVAAYQKTEVLKTANGFYILEYSPYGPFSEEAGDWLPVKIHRIENWSTGGIKGKEMLAFLEQQKSPTQDETGINRELPGVSGVTHE